MQTYVTAGFSGGLALTLLVPGLSGRSARMEDPGLPLSRRALEIGGLSLVPIPVDAQGIDVDHGIAHARDCAPAMVRLT